MLAQINEGDLVWSECYGRLGVVSKILTDVSGYSKETPGFVLVDPVHPVDGVVVSGVREHTVFRDGTHCKLVKLADGYKSAHLAAQLAIANEELGY